ncbi:aminotransferase class I/II-fold pyridoxal phosphate-dependent enzyme [Leucobacter soli]|uniref:N-succinyldiaminopimelate aminotransferase DapC n=1 Tax=Leucobacter soli TaxID=2812850 RepID=A0A916NPQ8_9MICO|nr:aminotransferase class I/II-fold pyridoxal phosphate-dependent enzyme [Leucobacter soli]CAG7616761.1 putative N-succinyldiaminopimelate aminotransferase DapC [Leucobacter soli]
MSERWREVAAATGLAAADGSTRPTIFAEMSALAARTGAANLGQGFPDEDGPEWIREAAIAAIRDGGNQYPPGRGAAELRAAIAEHQRRRYGIELDAEREVLVTAGATEALTAAILALAGPGDEVLTLEPFYDSHAAAIALAGARHVTVPLVPTVEGFRLDLEALRRAVSPRTRVILVNTPHNPTGTVLTGDELSAIAAAAERVDAVVVTDEVYEHLTFDGARHLPIATLPGMRERTLTVSSAGKTFSLTGWKIGWATGPARLVEAVLTVKQFLTYSGGAPFQPAIARALTEGDADVAALQTVLDARRELLIHGLHDAGFATVRPEGTYFVCADASPFIDGERADASPPINGERADGSPFTSAEVRNGADFARWLTEHAGVACIPLSAFCREGSATAEALANWVRFTFVKDETTIRTAIERLGELR